MANCEFCKMQDNCPGLNDCVHREDNTEPVAWEGRTEELLALADVSIKERPARNRLYKLQDAANPETIKQLIELVRLQHKAILEYNKYTRGVMIPQTRFQGQEAIAAFNKFEGGK